MDRIRASFGRHDVSQIRSHGGPAVDDAATELGARAYALGDDVAFAGDEPDLFTVAHEAAHAIQQAAGAPRSEADGGSDDLYERNADAVADAVVAGRSAEPLLDEITATPSTPSLVVQRKPSARKAAWEYLEPYRTRVITAIHGRFLEAGLALSHPGFQWNAIADAGARVAGAIKSFVERVPGQALKQLMKLSYPADLEAVVDGIRRDSTEWIPSIGVAIGIAFDEPVLRSLERIALRVRTLYDRNKRIPRASEVVASSPLDGVIAEVMTAPGAVVVDPHGGDAREQRGARPFTDGAREVEYVWLGQRDPSLWHWIQVTSPKDAAAEDVAKTPLAGGEVLDGSEQAYRIAAHPPYFGIPIETARLIPAAVQFAPEHVKRQLAAGDVGPRVADSAAFEESQVSDDAALAHHTKAQPGDEEPEVTLPRIREQLSVMTLQLSPWKLAGPLVGASRFADRRRSEIAGDPRRAQTWKGCLAAQERVLRVAASDLAELHGNVVAQGLTPKDAARLGPITRVFEAYAKAAGASHLGAEAMAAYAEASQQRALLSVAFAEDAARVAGAATGGDRSAEVSHVEPAKAVRAPGDDSDDAQPDGLARADLATRAADQRLRVLRGQKLDPDTVDLVTVDAEETTMRSRIAAIRQQVAVIESEADDVGITKELYESGMPTLRAFANYLTHQLVPRWIGELDGAGHWKGPTDGNTANRTLIEQRRKALASVDAGMRRVQHELQFDKYVAWANENIARQRLHNAFKSLAIQLGIMIVTGQIASGALVAARGVVLGGQLLNDVRGAGLAYKAAEVLLHASLATVTQGVVTGEQVGAAEIGEAAMAMVLANAAMKPFQKLLRGDVELEKQLQKAAHERFIDGQLAEKASATPSKLGAAAKTAGKVVKKGAQVAGEVAAETATGIATSHVAHAVVTGEGPGSMASSEEVIHQGISIGANRLVAVRTHRMHDRIAHAAAAAKARASGDLPAYEALLAKVDALGGRASKASRSLDDAAALVIESRSLLLEEQRLYLRRKQHDPDAAADARANANDQAELGPEFATVPLRAADLTPVVEGHSYEGTSKQIHDALERADAMLRSKAVRVFDPATGVWTLAFEGRVIRVLDRDAIAKRSPRGRQARDADPARTPSATEAETSSARSAGIDELPADRAPMEDLGNARMPVTDELVTGARPVAEAAAAPIGAFHGGAQKTPDPVAIKQASVDALGRLAGRMKRDAKGNTIELVAAGGGKRTVRVVVEPLVGDRPPVARYDDTALSGDGEITVYLSDRAAEHHVERALAHELAEIEHRLQGGAHGDDALLPGSKAEDLTGHDVGRLAELEVVQRQLRDARAANQPEQAARLRNEVYELLVHLGLGQPAGEARLTKLLDRYGRASPLLAEVSKSLPELRAAAKEAVTDWRNTDAEVWNKAETQKDASAALHEGTATDSQRAVLAAELQREVADVGLMLAVRERGARTVVSVLTPGSGEIGIKSLNDNSIGRDYTNKVLAARSQVYQAVFASRGLTIVHEDFKVTTVVSTLPAKELAPALKAAIGEIASQMRPRFRAIFDEARVHWTAQKGKADDAPKRLKAIETVLKKLDDDPAFTFTFHVGAAELSGGPTAGYDEVLGARMAATRAANMSRDPALAAHGDQSIGDSRGLIYSEEKFVDLAREAAVLQRQLRGDRLPWKGRDVVLIEATGELHAGLVGAIRKNKLDTTTWTAAQKQTLERFRTYLDHGQTLDVILRFDGKVVGTQGSKVAETADLVTRLRSRGAIDAATARAIDAVLAGTLAPQEGAGSEAVFHNRAANDLDRVVLNADIKGLGIDVIQGNSDAITKIAAGGDVDEAARGAGKEIYKLKRDAVTDIRVYYTGTLVPAAEAKAAAQGMALELSAADRAGPNLLLGGDEITISIPRVFEELGLVPGFVATIQSAARARVAVAHTGTVDGAKGHADAMKMAESAHNMLKEAERVAQDLGEASKRLKGAKKDRADELAVWFERLYTNSDEIGTTQLRDRDGKVVVDLEHRMAEAKALLRKVGQ